MTTGWLLPTSRLAGLKSDHQVAMDGLQTKLLLFTKRENQIRRVLSIAIFTRFAYFKTDYHSQG
jgi:hypothetical protein